MRRSALAILTTVATLALTACGGDSTTDVDTDGGGGETLSQAEAITVTNALFAEMSRAMANITFSGATAGSGLIMPSFTFNGSCTSGGSVSGSGTYTSDATGAFYDLTYTPNNCKVNSGKLLTVNGDPNIHMTWSLPSSSSSSAQLHYTVKGGIKWSGGSCKLDYTLNSSTQTGHGSIKGSMCGTNVDTTF
jgi:hypothetical protein